MCIQLALLEIATSICLSAVADGKSQAKYCRDMQPFICTNYALRTSWILLTIAGQ